ncbi:hypothetical protein J2Z69_001992 [Paenibacillus shirakamiensis]|uniref:Copper amine oxidase-like N-terminal domain-containing protein n=1 Tax=Paenibacillus shirakamiensis TaxID=1265935 RepID=A0ABS4JGV1_9BACL|nr:copper amine oxidase N-terminal domain-containing protein [Paenibacillus shirakamiensis]MBP2000949.1 hypothetical protein [Paenibacillus shirakamiensis]
MLRASTKMLTLIVISSALFMTFVISSSAPSVSASSSAYPGIEFNGMKQHLQPSAMLMQGTTLMPMRAMFNLLGTQVLYNEETQTATATRGRTSIEITIGSSSALISDGTNNKTIHLSTPATMHKGTFMVPLRCVLESLGAKVDWNRATSTISIYSSRK